MAQGRCEEAAEVIQSIAKRNKRKVPTDLLPRLQVFYLYIFNFKCPNTSAHLHYATGERLWTPWNSYIKSAYLSNRPTDARIYKFVEHFIV